MREGEIGLRVAGATRRLSKRARHRQIVRDAMTKSGLNIRDVDVYVPFEWRHLADTPRFRPDQESLDQAPLGIDDSLAAHRRDKRERMVRSGSAFEFWSKRFWIPMGLLIVGMCGVLDVSSHQYGLTQCAVGDLCIGGFAFLFALLHRYGTLHDRASDKALIEEEVRRRRPDGGDGFTRA